MKSNEGSRPQTGKGEVSPPPYSLQDLLVGRDAPGGGNGGRIFPLRLALRPATDVIIRKIRPTWAGAGVVALC
jgi:hypothetical protein